MRPTFLKVLTVALLPSMLTGSAFGWGAGGHMTIAAFAYDELAEKHPVELAKLLNVLHQHPEWPAGVKHSMEKRTEAVAPADRDRYAFMVAARWPDDVRQDPQYHHGTWHYMDTPTSPRGQPLPTTQPDAENAVSELIAQVDLLKQGKAGPDQGVAFCWVLHLIGDIHQPMHAVSLYTNKFPDGDKGGNLLYVRVPPDGATINLHQLWDGLLGRSQNYRDAVNEANTLRHRPDLAKKRLPNMTDGNPADWAKESFQIAVRVAYLNDTLQGGTKQSGELLPADYTKNAQAAAEVRGAMAGYRLTDTLLEVAKTLPAASQP